MNSYDALKLRQKGRLITPPFRLMLDTSGNKQELICRHILRNMPGKRLVFSGVWEHQQAVVAKIYLDPIAAKRHCQRELKGVQALMATHVPTPPLLFQGCLADTQTPLLVFAKMGKAQDLSEHLLTIHSNADRLAVLTRVVTAIARLHDAGLKQRDIHPGNFLVSDNDVMIIDGDEIENRSGRPLGQRKSLSNLALFFAQFYPRFDIMAPELLDVYIKKRQWPQSSEITAQTIRRIQRWRQWRQARFIRKTKRSCTAYIAKSSWRRFMACDRTWYSPARQQLLDDPDAFINNGQILKAGNTATVARVSIESQVVVIKRYNIKNIRHALRRCLRSSRAMVSWQNAHRLRFLGIDTPCPLAVIEERWGILRQRAYFVMEDLPGKTIDHAIGENIDNPEILANYFHKIAVLLEQLSAARISHGDFKATNFLVSTNRLYLLDLDSMQAHRHASSFKRAFHKDVSRLERNWNNLPQLRNHLDAIVRHDPKYSG